MTTVRVKKADAPLGAHAYDLELTTVLMLKLRCKTHLPNEHDLVGGAIANLINLLCDRGIVSTKEAFELVPGKSEHVLVPPEPPPDDPPADAWPQGSTSLDYALDGDLNLKLPVRVWTVLDFAAITTLRDLLPRTRDSLLRMRNFGDRSIRALEENLAVMGLRLGYTALEIRRLDTHIDELDMSVRLSNLLHNLNCKYVVDILALTERQILTKGSRKSLKELTSLLADFDFQLRSGGK